MEEFVAKKGFIIINGATIDVTSSIKLKTIPVAAGTLPDGSLEIGAYKVEGEFILPDKPARRASFLDIIQNDTVDLSIQSDVDGYNFPGVRLNFEFNDDFSLKKSEIAARFEKIITKQELKDAYFYYTEGIIFFINYPLKPRAGQNLNVFWFSPLVEGNLSISLEQ